MHGTVIPSIHNMQSIMYLFKILGLKFMSGCTHFAFYRTCGKKPHNKYTPKMLTGSNLIAFLAYRYTRDYSSAYMYWTHETALHIWEEYDKILAHRFTSRWIHTFGCETNNCCCKKMEPFSPFSPFSATSSTQLGKITIPCWSFSGCSSWFTTMLCTSMFSLVSSCTSLSVS